MAITKEDIQRVVEGVAGAAGRVRHVASCDGYVSVRLAVGGMGETEGDALAGRVRGAIEAMGSEVRQVKLELVQEASQTAGALADKPPVAPGRQVAQGPQGPAAQANALPNVKRVIAVGAGKGGVGKSTVAVNLAVGLTRRGLRAGLLDADIYGPSAPTLLGLADLPVEGTGQVLYPFRVHGIKAMTIGKLVEPEKPLIWRGPMAHSAFRQLALQTEWGELDYLIVDLPPGTGDVPLTMAQLLPLAGAVIVCTPQKVAQDDAVRAAGMFRQLNVPLLGVVENMSYFVGDDGKEYDLFGRGGAAAMASRLGLGLLGSIPIHMELRANSDAGNPTANFTGNKKLAAELDAMTGKVVAAADAMEGASRGPELSVR